jgi:formate dehydrogenase subunit delta
MPVDKLIYMVNQIIRNLVIRGDDEAVTATTEHLRLFWDPRMRREILAHLDAGGTGLEPLALKAVEGLRA